jgi:hypothetical protein
MFPAVCQASREVVSERAAALAALEEPLASLRFLLGTYAFARAGGEQAGYGEIAASLLARQTAGPVAEFWSEFSDGPSLWRAFARQCEAARIKPNEKLNRGPIEGFYTLARDSPSAGLIAKWAKGLGAVDGLRTLYEGLRRIRGVGPKIAAFVCRDAVLLAGSERAVPRDDSWLLQPVDVWMHRTAAYLSRKNRDVNGSEVARFLADAADQAGVSGIALNQGAWFFGSQVAKREDRLTCLLDCLT